MTGATAHNPLAGTDLKSGIIPRSNNKSRLIGSQFRVSLDPLFGGGPERSKRKEGRKDRIGPLVKRLNGSKA